jgi:Rrf2 family protein
VRGPQGGYVLGREPKGITVGDIVRALEGPIAPVACISEDCPEDCRRAEICASRLVWSKVRDCIADVLDSHSLADLVEETQRISSSGRLMYYI